MHFHVSYIIPIDLVLDIESSFQRRPFIIFFSFWISFSGIIVSNKEKASREIKVLSCVLQRMALLSWSFEENRR